MKTLRDTKIRNLKGIKESPLRFVGRKWFLTVDACRDASRVDGRRLTVLPTKVFRANSKNIIWIKAKSLKNLATLEGYEKSQYFVLGTLYYLLQNTVAQSEGKGTAGHKTLEVLICRVERLIDL